MCLKSTIALGNKNWRTVFLEAVLFSEGRDSTVLVIALVVHVIHGWDWPQASYTISIIIDCLEKSIDDFEKRFNDLAHAALKEVKNENKVSVEDLQIDLTLLPSKIKPNHASYLKDNFDKLRNASNLQEIFMHLNLYWDCYNYTLLQVIIDKYGSDDLKQRMQSYTTDIEQFEKETTVAEFIPHCNTKGDHSFYSDELRSVINKPSSEYTLFEVEELRRTFCQEFNLPRFVLIFSGLQAVSYFELPHYEYCYTLIVLLPCNMSTALCAWILNLVPSGSKIF